MILKVMSNGLFVWFFFWMMMVVGGCGVLVFGWVCSLDFVFILRSFLVLCLG